MRKLTKYNKEEFQLVIDNSETIADVCRELSIGTKAIRQKERELNGGRTNKEIESSIPLIQEQKKTYT